MTTDHVSVYRSTEANADQEASAIKNLLLQYGLDAVVADDTQPGVESGYFEVRVPFADAARAEELIAETQLVSEDEIDPSPEFDSVIVIETQGTTGEMEAQAVQSILDANGINAVLIGSSTLPSLGFQVRVAKDDAGRAETVLAEARAAGPAAAVEAERESEGLS